MLRVVHAKDMHNHPVDNVYFPIRLGVEGNRFGQLSVHQRLTAYSARGQLMYHEVFIYVEDIIGSTCISDVPALKFCKRNFRTPAWVNNVISLHGS
jgi:hypothetical protein